MLDKNVGDALLKLDLSPQGDPPSTQVSESSMPTSAA
jgi:hypothetical protein